MIEILDFGAVPTRMTFRLGSKVNKKERAALGASPHLDKAKVTVSSSVGGVVTSLDLDKWSTTWDEALRLLTLTADDSKTTWPRRGVEWVELKVEGAADKYDLTPAPSASSTLNPTDLETVAGFPLLVESIAYPQPTPAGPTDDLQQMVDRKLGMVLGGAGRANNAKGIVAALKRAFNESDVDGVTTWTWNPTSSIGMSDVGASVTGRQASLAALGTSSLTVIEPLLDGLAPLVLSDSFNPDKIDTERAIVKSSWRALVDELGADGGPRSVRVDTLENETRRALIALGKELGIVPRATSAGAATVFKTFDDITTTRKFVVLPADETTLTNYVIIVDQMRTVADRWKDFFTSVSTGAPVDVGAAVVLLERALSVVSESVTEATAALDSVFVGPAERAARRFDLKFKDSNKNTVTSDLSITDVLSWIDDFGSREAPQTLQESGRTGVPLVRATSATLKSLTKNLRDAFVTSGGALNHPRVRTATEELVHSLERVHKAAGDLDDVYNADGKAKAGAGATP
jgi:hypothetical protein